jgi:hypothetical protein
MEQITGVRPGAEWGVEQIAGSQAAWAGRPLVMGRDLA